MPPGGSYIRLPAARHTLTVDYVCRPCQYKMRVSLRTLFCANRLRLVRPVELLDWLGVAACGRMVMVMAEEDAKRGGSVVVAVGSGAARLGGRQYG